MKDFRFPKIKKRNAFTKIFGGAGKRRYIWQLKSRIPRPIDRVFFPKYKLQKTRRAHQGWRNRTFGTIQALKIRLQFGRRKTTQQFRR